jgi:hypothetical protein
LPQPDKISRIRTSEQFKLKLNQNEAMMKVKSSVKAGQVHPYPLSYPDYPSIDPKGQEEDL